MGGNKKDIFDTLSKLLELIDNVNEQLFLHGLAIEHLLKEVERHSKLLKCSDSTDTENPAPEDTGGINFSKFNSLPGGPGSGADAIGVLFPSKENEVYKITMPEGMFTFSEAKVTERIDQKGVLITIPERVAVKIDENKFMLQAEIEMFYNDISFSGITEDDFNRVTDNMVNKISFMLSVSKEEAIILLKAFVAQYLQSR